MVLFQLCSLMLPGLGAGGAGASQGVSSLQCIPRSVGLVPLSGVCLLSPVQFLLSEAQLHCRNMLYITVLSGRSLEEVVNTCAHWCDSIKAKMEGAVSSLAALALL